MRPEKVLEVIDRYEKVLDDAGVAPEDHPHNELIEPYRGGIPCLAHCAAMLPKMRVFVSEGRIDKVFRWLGFVQGVLWSRGIFTLEELMNHSRPDQEEGPA